MTETNVMHKLTFTIVFYFGISLAIEEGRLWEYCPDETFSTVCSEQEVVVMQKALYGHIKIGRCVDEDLVGHLGCYTDQLSVMDRKCSGKTSCIVDFKESDMEGEFPCPLSKALARYLEASYICQTVHIPRERCRAIYSIPSSSRDQFISSQKMAELGCGQESSPIVLEAKEQQRINISLIDLNWKVASRDDSPVRCPVNYGHMLDMVTNDIVPLCGGLVRERQLFLSKGHRVQLILSNNAQNGDKANFLLSFKALGCPKFTPPPHTWVEQNRDDITMGCSNTDKSWRMRCIGNHWLGPQMDCSQRADNSIVISSQAASQNQDRVLGMPPVVAFSVIGGVFLIIASAIVTSVIGILCIRSRKNNSSGESEYYLTATKPVFINGTQPADQFATYRSVQVKLPKKAQSQVNVQPKGVNLLDSQNTLPSLGSVPKYPPGLRESPHYYLLEGRDTTETEPLYDVVYQGCPTHDSM